MSLAIVAAALTVASVLVAIYTASITCTVHAFTANTCIYGYYYIYNSYEDGCCVNDLKSGLYTSETT